MDGARVELAVIESEYVRPEDRPLYIPISMWIGGAILCAVSFFAGLTPLMVISGVVAVPGAILTSLIIAFRSRGTERVLTFDVDATSVRCEGAPCEVRVWREGIRVDETMHRFPTPYSQKNIQKLRELLERDPDERGDPRDIPDALLDATAMADEH